MTDFVQSLMGELLKNTSGLQSVALTGTPDPVKIGLQILDIQKTAFDNSYNAIVEMQDQAEAIIMNASPVSAFPSDWSKLYRENQAAVKRSVDESFKKAEAYFKAAVSEDRPAVKPVASAKTAENKSPQKKTVAAAPKQKKKAAPKTSTAPKKKPAASKSATAKPSASKPATTKPTAT